MKLFFRHLDSTVMAEFSIRTEALHKKHDVNVQRSVSRRIRVSAVWTRKWPKRLHHSKFISSRFWFPYMTQYNFQGHYDYNFICLSACVCLQLPHFALRSHLRPFHLNEWRRAAAYVNCVTPVCEWQPDWVNRTSSRYKKRSCKVINETFVFLLS